MTTKFGSDKDRAIFLFEQWKNSQGIEVNPWSADGHFRLQERERDRRKNPILTYDMDVIRQWILRDPKNASKELNIPEHFAQAGLDKAD